MATVQLDTCYNEQTETIDGVIADFSAEFDITGTVVDPHGPGGGWPIVEWTGTKDQLRKLAMAHYGADETMLETVDLPELA